MEKSGVILTRIDRKYDMCVCHSTLKYCNRIYTVKKARRSNRHHAIERAIGFIPSSFGQHKYNVIDKQSSAHRIIFVLGQAPEVVGRLESTQKHTNKLATQIQLIVYLLITLSHKPFKAS